MGGHPANVSGSYFRRKFRHVNRAGRKVQDTPQRQKSEHYSLCYKLENDMKLKQTSTQTAEEIGLDVQTLTPKLVEQYHQKSDKGVLLSNVKAGTIAAMVGIKSGSIIVQVNREPAKNADDFKKMIQESSNKQVMLLLTEGTRKTFRGV
jgi:C-terminal processing protease CtpA/Prc